jgi:hypothetical protein
MAGLMSFNFRKKWILLPVCPSVFKAKNGILCPILLKISKKSFTCRWFIRDADIDWWWRHHYHNKEELDNSNNQQSLWWLFIFISERCFVCDLFYAISSGGGDGRL